MSLFTLYDAIKVDSGGRVSLPVKFVKETFTNGSPSCANQLGSQFLDGQIAENSRWHLSWKPINAGVLQGTKFDPLVRGDA